MNDTEGLRRLVEATERVAKALERMAEQQAEFLATMPAEEEPLVRIWNGTPEDPTATIPPRTVSDEDWRKRIEQADPLYQAGHAYDALCDCPACWAERRRLKRTDAP